MYLRWAFVHPETERFGVAAAQRHIITDKRRESSENKIKSRNKNRKHTRAKLNHIVVTVIWFVAASQQGPAYVNYLIQNNIIIISSNNTQCLSVLKKKYHRNII